MSTEGWLTQKWEMEKALEARYQEGYEVGLLCAEFERFVNKIWVYIAAGTVRSEAFSKAILECQSEGILRNYLGKGAPMVFYLLIKEWDWENALRKHFMEAERIYCL